MSGAVAEAGADAFSDLYRERVLDHGRAPRLAGTLDAPCERAELSNPLCGDRVVVTLRRDSQDRITELRHASEGCLLCVASASLMAEAMQGSPSALAPTRFAELRAALTGGEATGGLGSLEALAGIAAHPARLRCVLLPWEALLQALGRAPAP